MTTYSIYLTYTYSKLSATSRYQSRNGLVMEYTWYIPGITEEVREKVTQERRRLLHRDGTPRDCCKAEVSYIYHISYTWYYIYQIPGIGIEYTNVMDVLYYFYEWTILIL